MRRLRAALAFLTVLPLAGGPEEAPQMALGLPLFPLVGALVGAAAGVLAWGVAAHLSRAAGGAAALLAEVLLTRGLHWDGLFDTIDGLLAHPREKSLAAMRDPRVGGGAAIGGGALLLLFAALAAAIPGPELPLALAAAGAAGRAAVVIAVRQFPYARAEGMGKAFQGQGRRGLLAVAVAIGALIAALGPRGAVAGALAAGTALLGGRYAVRRFGGCTGDVYGAVEVVTEILVLAALAWRG